MAYTPNYDKRVDSGSSGGERNDLNPQRSYDVDIRRLPEDMRETAYAADTRNVGKQRRVEKFLRATRSAGKFRQNRRYNQPWTNPEGQTPAFIKGDRFGRGGSTAYADKPQPSTEKLYY